VNAQLDRAVQLSQLGGVDVDDDLLRGASGPGRPIISG